MPAVRQALSVFVSYALEDEDLRAKLEKQLAILRRQGLIEIWDKADIAAGADRARTIDTRFEAADIVLLLISPDFFASDDVGGVELERVMARHEAQTARVIPVILRPCLWERGEFAKLQALPTDGEPVTSAKWPSQDAAFVVVAEGIARAVEERIERRTAEVAARPGSAAAPIWRVPYRLNVSFTGREGLLEALHRALPGGAAVALTGLGGIGKTQLALEYAYRRRDEYRVVWWVRADDEATLAADYAGLATALGLAEREAKEQAVVVAAVRLWLEQNTGWLLVFDNAGNRAAVRDYVPQGRGAVIITSREPVWSGVATPFGLAMLTPEESVTFLCKRTGDTDAAAAAALAEALGRLPLALEQAAAYIEDTGASLQHYHELFEEHHAELLQRGRPSTEYPGTVATTWTLSIGKVDEAARALLNLCAFFAPEGIPLDAIREEAGDLPSPLDSVAADAVRLDSAIAGLLRFSLIGRKGEGLSVHRLVQAVVRDRLEDAERQAWAAAAVALLNTRFPFDSHDVRTWPVCARLLTHVLQAAHWAEAFAVAPEVTARLLNQAGLYLRWRAEFTGARALFERALRIGEAALGAEHPEVASYASSLGEVLEDQGDLAGARALFERALRIDETALGAEHLTVGIRLGKLSGVLRAQGDFAGARPLLERVVRIGEAALGAQHPPVATRLNNLGLVLPEQGDWAGAQALFEQALRSREAALGAEHPAVARHARNLGGALRAQGDFAGARPLLERALRIDEAALGAEHPTVAIGLNDLGVVLRAQGDLASARALFERALRIDEAALGAEHPTVAIRLNNLGDLLRAQVDLAGARALYERALRIDEAALGAEHPTVAIRLNNLGDVLRAQGDLAGARALFERALRIDEAALGAEHVTVSIPLINLGSVLQDLGDFASARVQLERALRIGEAALGAEHPAVAALLNKLGSVLRAQDDFAGARALYERALRIDEAALGAEHPTVAIRLNNLGDVLRAQGDLAGARAQLERALRIDEAAYGPDHADVARDANNLGSVLQAQGDFDGARAQFERALRIDEAALGAEHPTVAIRLNNLGSVLQDLSDFVGARVQLERALRIFHAALGDEHPSTKTVRQNLESLLQQMPPGSDARSP